jgi:ribonuclease Z
MRPSFRSELVNPAFGDPGVLVDFLFERRALLFDFGDNRTLSPRQLLRVSHAFVSHTHMDHFMGFDWFLRICLGRPQRVSVHGPPGIIDRMEHKLAAYTWNLVDNYPGDFTLEVSELAPDGRARGALFVCRRRFRREPLPDRSIPDGVIVAEPGFRVRAALLDHGVPCLGFALEETGHVNVWRNRLADLGLEVGPWLRDLKAAVLARAPDETPVRAWWRRDGVVHERTLPLGTLVRDAVRVVPGLKLAYVTDVGFTGANATAIADLAAAADTLFIEAMFLEKDAPLAAQRHHLTALQAGRLARRAGARRVVPFHFSPRYQGREHELRAEVERGFRGDA